VGVSIRDVADRAGVSLGTVSNALIRADLVAQPTLERVRAAIEELGFIRNEAARQLRTGRSRTIALLVLDVGNPFFTDEMRRNGVPVVLVDHAGSSRQCSVSVDDVAGARLAASHLLGLDHPSVDLGAAAAELLIDEVERPGDHHHRQVRFDPVLVPASRRAQRRPARAWPDVYLESGRPGRLTWPGRR
jgi:DNA-binding LacI/PurR family transcriptional regulator